MGWSLGPGHNYLLYWLREFSGTGSGLSALSVFMSVSDFCIKLHTLAFILGDNAQLNHIRLVLMYRV